MDIANRLPLSLWWAGVTPIIRKASRNTSLPWSRKLLRRGPVLPSHAIRLGGSTLTLHFDWVVPPRLLIPTPLTLEIPVPTDPMVVVRLMARTRRATATLVLTLKSLVSSPLESLEVKTRKQEVVF